MTWDSLDEIIDERNFANAKAAALEAELVPRVNALDAAIAERDAARAEVAELRIALVSLVDGKSEYGVAQVAGVDTTAARRIMDLAYNRN